MDIKMIGSARLQNQQCHEWSVAGCLTAGYCRRSPAADGSIE